MRSAARAMAVVVAVSAALGASPAPAAVMDWTFQAIVPSYYWPSHGSLALGMRTGMTWPTVLVDTPPTHSNQLMGLGLTPAGWMPSALSGLTSGERSYARIKPGSDGRLAAAWQSGSQVCFSQATGPLWQTAEVVNLVSYPSATTAPDVDYLSGHRPVVAWSDQNAIRIAVHDGLMWTYDTISYAAGSQVPSTGGLVSLATDGQDNIGVAYADGRSVYFACRAQGGDDWLGTTVALYMPGHVRHLSLAFGPNDEPGLCVLDTNGNLSFATYRIQQGVWQTEQIAYGITSSRVNLVFNSLGQPATAVLTGPVVSYALNDGNGWQWSSLPTGYDSASGLNVTPDDLDFAEGEAALAFDGDDLPVIAYCGDGSGLLLAYDPILVPEPGAVLLLVAAIGALGFRRRGH